MGSRRYMGDARGGSSAGSGGNTVRNDLYRETIGNRGKVGVVATDIRMCTGEKGYKGGGRSREAW